MAPETQNDDSSKNPTEEELRDYFTSLSNWGRWGEGDQLGTLNLLGPAQTQKAAALVKEGVVVSLAREISQKRSRGSHNAGVVHFMTVSGSDAKPKGKSAAADWFGMPIHGFEFTHLDSLSHEFWDGHMYNGEPASKIRTDRGATIFSIEVAIEKIVGCGVFADIPAARGIESLEAGEPLRPDDLEAALKWAHTDVESGDILIVRTGRDVGQNPSEAPRVLGAGLHASCIPWLRERDVAMIVSDGTNDVRPSGYELVDSPVHAVGITAMGLWLLDSAYLEGLSKRCAEVDRWRFMFCCAPLALKNSTGSPVNPLAIL